jgi:hypothetical protein
VCVRGGGGGVRVYDFRLCLVFVWGKNKEVEAR